MSDKKPQRSRERKRSTPAPALRERAAFQVAIFSNNAEPAIWQTQAYHEETDTRMLWESLPNGALAEWMRAIIGIPTPIVIETIELPAAEQAPETPSEPDVPLTLSDILAEPAEPADFTRIHGIGPVIQQRLQQAGIISYQHFAQHTSQQLAQIIDIQGLTPERIQTWQQHANQIAMQKPTTAMLEEHSTSLGGEPNQQSQPPATSAQPAALGDMAIIEIVLSGDDEILHAALVPAASHILQPAHPYEQVIRFFIESPAQGVPLPMEVEIELGELEIEQQTHAHLGLQAQIVFAIHGLAARLLSEAHEAAGCYIIALDLQHGTSEVVAAHHQQLQPGVYEYPLLMRMQPLRPGRYRTLAIVLLVGTEFPVVQLGPKVWVQ
jgi:predicted flap endonuclease-1-like 5' DNA nuclease